LACDLFNDSQCSPPDDCHHHPTPDDDSCPPSHPDDCSFDEFRRNIPQYADISLPVDIDPSASVGRIVTEWLGDPVVVCRKDHCDNTCRITITQRVRVIIPVTYCVITCVGDPDIDCCVRGSCDDEKSE